MPTQQDPPIAATLPAAGVTPGGVTGAATTPTAPSRPRGRRSRRTLVGAIVPLGLLALWQAVTAAGVFLPVQLPSPVAVWGAGVELVERGELGGHLAISTQRVLIGFGIGAVLGLVMGAVVGLSRRADVLLGPTVGAFRAVPSLAWVPLLILWMQIGETSRITLIAIGAFFPVYTTVASGLRHVDQHLVEVGHAYGLRGPRLLARIQLPAAVPSVISGMRLALAQSWLFLVAAELIASSQGLGFLLLDSQNNGRTDRLLLAIVLLGLLGKLTDAVIGVVERRLLRVWA
ncbi:MAG: ABC transporter permease [Nitriliruptor sp.]|nr:MAG: ABC transporter permease [Nitriliruptor sp.]